jgi:hypothetical protein
MQVRNKALKGGGCPFGIFYNLILDFQVNIHHKLECTTLFLQFYHDSNTFLQQRVESL